jgi:hypothetical protein
VDIKRREREREREREGGRWGRMHIAIAIIN